MSRLSLDALRANPPKSRPERSLTLCLAPHLIGNIQALVEERDQLAAARRGQAGAESEDQRPQTLAKRGPSSREREIEARFRVLLAEMAEHEGELRLRANWDDGTWRRWVNDNPARVEGEPGYDFDTRATRGVCNADTLIENIPAFAYTWDGARLADADWSTIFDGVVAVGDKAEIAQAIVAMYEVRVDFPLWRTGLSATLSKLSASEVLESVVSLASGSSDGNPASSTAPTTPTATE